MGLYEKELGIFIRSRATLPELRKHFRKFTRVQDEQGKWYYFRFWEGDSLAHLLRRADVQKQQLIVNPSTIYYLPSIQNQFVKISAVSRCEQSTIGKFALSPDDFREFRTFRHRRYFTNIKNWLLANYTVPQNVDDIDQFLRIEIQFAMKQFETTDGEVIADYVAASWLLGKRAYEVIDHRGNGELSCEDLARHFHAKAFEIKNGARDRV